MQQYIETNKHLINAYITQLCSCIEKASDQYTDVVRDLKASVVVPSITLEQRGKSTILFDFEGYEVTIKAYKDNQQRLFVYKAESTVCVINNLISSNELFTFLKDVINKNGEVLND